MKTDQHEVMAITDHTKCFSPNLMILNGSGCTCKHDMVETRIVGTEDRRNWRFPLGGNPLQIGQIVSEETMALAQTTGFILQADKRPKKTEEPAIEAEKGHDSH